MEEGKAIDKLIEYEEGTLEGYDVLELFSSLIGSDLLGPLSKQHKLSAQTLIDGGLISPAGKILIAKEDVQKQQAINGGVQ